MNFSTIPFGSMFLLLCLANLPGPIRLSCSLPARAAMTFNTQSVAAPTSATRRLQTELQGRAISHLSPKWKNPGISERGLDPAIVTAIQQQQTYLHSATMSLHSSRLGAMTFGPKPGALCHDSAIRTVNGKALGAIFTPQPPNNSYRIEGCFFGSVRGRIVLQPHSAYLNQIIPPINLTVDVSASSWSENEIDAHLDPQLSGIPDLSVTLIIQLAGGQRLELPGCLFVAARSRPKLLDSIPASWISLQPSGVRSRSIERLEYVSPPVKGSGVPADAAGASAFVSRLDSENFGAGSDVYDFAQLNPGWVVDSVQLRTYAIECPGSSPNRQSAGHWDTQWSGRKLTVDLQDDVCTSRVSPSFKFNLSLSQYALKVWVVGPAGTNPVPDALLHSQNRSFTKPPNR